MFKQLVIFLAIMSLVLTGCSQKAAPVAPATPTPEPVVQPTPTISVDDIVLTEDDTSVSIGEVI